MNDEFNNRIIDSIKQTIRENIDNEYTEYKNKCLEELEYKIEAKRNKTVSAILDGIDVKILSQQPYSLEPIIQIRMENKIIVKGD